MKINIAKVSFYSWIGSILAFIFIVIYISITKKPEQTWPITAFIILLGIVSFLVLILSSLYTTYKNKHPKTKLIKFFFYLLFFPFWPLLNLIKYWLSKKKLKKDRPKLFNVIFLLIFVGPIWLGSYFLVFFLSGYLSGFFPNDIDILGKSMLPTFKNEQVIEAYLYNSFAEIVRPLKKGDIIIFQTGNTKNDETNKLVSYVKRVIALPGDNLVIKNGYVYLNNEIVDEPYTQTPRSTYGGSFLPECKSMDIPSGYVFTIGDNRKNSQDSREIGLINLKDISNRIPTNKQTQFKQLWREPNRSIQDINQPSFDSSEYLDKLNQIRSEHNLQILKHSQKLDNAAKLRAEAIITYDERKTKPSDSKYPMKSALKDANYFNTIFGEVVNIGYFNSEELLTNWLEFETKNNLLNSDYQETGIAAVIGKINDCEVQVIVQEFGGYIPPNYKQIDIESWEKSLNRLRDILPSWENIKTSPNKYPNNKDRVERLIQIINIRISRIQAVVTRMKANQWLTNEETTYTNEDQSLYNEQEQIATYLNSQRW